MEPEQHGYFVHREPVAAEGLRYAYRLDEEGEFPDPASRWQPDGVHAPSAVFFPEDFSWTDDTWRGIARDELVIYELHVGTFTEEGTLDAVIPRLPELVELGVTALELMPVAQFPGERNWGYDGVYPYAVQNSYGGPRALERLVDAAHRVGLAVLLDVVYNHFGPEGNYLGHFGPYFTDRYRTPWGNAVNFDGPECDPVRWLVIHNACMWVRDFHVDGLRLDAVHAIYDTGARHILAELQEAVQREAARQGRIVHVIAESNQNDVRLIDPPDRGGYGLDAVWSDDFHHSVHALLTAQRDGYYQDFGRAEHLAKAYTHGFVYDGCYSPFRRRRHGSALGARDRTRLVVCIQNHDQVGNRALGDRFGTLLEPAGQRLACGLLLVSPCVPLLFMGEEYAETRPFPFFCSFGDPALTEAVRRGRRAEFAALAFCWQTEIPDPQDPATFASAKLAWQWPEGTHAAGLRRLYQDLLAARRNWRALRDRQHTSVQLLDADPSPSAPREPGILVLQRGIAPGILVVANLSNRLRPLDPKLPRNRPVLLSTEEPRYGGTGAGEGAPEQLRPYEMLILGPVQ